MVAAVLALGACSASAPPSTDEPAAAPPLSNGVRGAATATVTWTAPDVESAIAGYELQWRPATDTDWTPVTGISRSATSHTITGLQPHVSYEVRIRALFPASDGAWSKSVTVPAMAPPAPSLAEPTASSNSITVTWTAPATGESVTSYELRWRSGTDMAWTPVTGISRSATNYTITGLQPNVTYEVRVRALFATNDGVWSETLAVPTTGASPPPNGSPPPTVSPPPTESPPPDPSGVCLTNTHPNSITVTWTALASDRPVTGYHLQWRPLFYSTEWNVVSDIASTVNRYAITELQQGFFFAVRVHAWHGSDAGPWFDGRWCEIRQGGTDPRFLSFHTASDEASVSEAATDYRFLIASYYAPEEHYPVTLRYRLSETGDMLHSSGVHTATISKPFPYANYVDVRFDDDDVDEADSTVTVTILPGPRYHVGTLSLFSFTVTDDDD